MNSFMQIGPKRIHLVRCRGGNIKHRALRLDVGTFSWGSEGFSLLLYMIFIFVCVGKKLLKAYHE